MTVPVLFAHEGLFRGWTPCKEAATDRSEGRRDVTRWWNTVALRIAVRAWLANLVSATDHRRGGRGRLMTTLAGTADLVAMVQTAACAPVLFALLAGTSGRSLGPANSPAWRSSGRC
jgi:hypothetical protein